MVRVGVSVMAVREREYLVDSLVRELGGSCVGVSFDDGCGIWENRLRASKLVDKNVFSHVLVLQDDVVLCSDFMSRVNEVVGEHPGDLVSFYMGYREKDKFFYARNEKEWLRKGGFYGEGCSWGLALCFPVKYVELIEGYWRDKSKWLGHDDSRVSYYLNEKEGLRTWFSFPCLVDHRDVGSVVGDVRGRRAVRFVGGVNG